MSEGTWEHLITSYITLRDKKASLKEQMETQLKQYTDAMIQIENYFKAVLDRGNVNSISCDAGTAFVRRKRKATVADREIFRKFVIDNENFDLADFSAKVEAVEDWVNEHEGQLPPGVNFQTYETVSIQRK